MILIVVIYSLFKGGRGTESLVGIEGCSGGFAGLLVAFVIITLCFTLLTGWMLFKETISWNECGYPWWKEDIKWDKSKIIMIPLLAFFCRNCGRIAWNWRRTDPRTIHDVLGYEPASFRCN